jgi:hypothetical protein
MFGGGRQQQQQQQQGCAAGAGRGAGASTSAARPAAAPQKEKRGHAPHKCRLCGIIEMHDFNEQRKETHPQLNQRHKESCKWFLMRQQGLTAAAADPPDFSKLDQLNGELARATEQHGWEGAKTWTLWDLRPKKDKYLSVYERYKPEK